MPLEAIFFSLSVYLLLGAVVLPVGLALVSKLDLPSPHLKACVSVSLGTLVMGFIVALFFPTLIQGAVILPVFGEVASKSILGLSLGAFGVIGLSWSLYSRQILKLAHPDVLSGLALLVVYSVLCLFSNLFPSGRLEEAAVDTAMLYAGLPVDVLIPYNVSRFILEGFDPNTLEVVPGWGASDRGPLLGLITAALFSLAGLGEKGVWLSTSWGPFFVYQAAGAFLNGLALFFIWVFSCRVFGRYAAALAVLLAVSTHFFFLNTLFVWPKFYMAFLFLTSLWVLEDTKRAWLAGLISAAAVLAHDSALFVVAALGLRLLFERKFLLLFKYSLGFLACFLPWFFVKGFVFTASPRLFYMHLFCYQGESLENLTFTGLFEDYWQRKGLWGAISARLENIAYPFNPWPAVSVYLNQGSGLLRYLNDISYLVFFQTWLAIGLIPSVLFVYAEYKQKILRAWLYPCLGGLFFLALISGCGGNAVNHIWVYPFFLLVCIVVGSFVASASWITGTLFSLGIAFNAFLLYFYQYYRPELKPFLHGSSSYGWGQVGLASLFLVLLVWFGSRNKENLESSQFSENNQPLTLEDV